MATGFTRRDGSALRQMRTERDLTERYVGHFELRIVLNALLLSAVWIAIGVLGVTGWLPYWLCVPIASVLVFLMYMPMHEATHLNINGHHRNLLWLNNAVGYLCSIPLLFHFPSHQMAHMAHHAYTNHPEKDPDYEANAGSPLKALSLNFIGAPIALLVFGVAAWIPPWRNLVEAKLTKSLDSARAAQSCRYSRLFSTLILLTMVAIAWMGYLPEVLTFWLLPSMFGLMLTGLVFAWLPHHPHNGYGRYTNTRATLFPFSGLICRGHDRHIVHHMFPSIPNYRMAEVFDAILPLLEERGTRIEGVRAGTNAPKVFLGTDPNRIAEIGREAALADALPFAES